MSDRTEYYVDPAALDAYSGSVPRIAAQLAEAGTSTSCAAGALPADCFGRVGQDVGLTTAFQEAVRAEGAGLAAVAAALDALASAVRDANTDYVTQDADHAALLNRAAQV